jgi:acyl-CoA thioesterase
MSTGSPTVDEMLFRDEFSRWLGIEVVEAKAGFCRARMTVRNEMLNGFGLAHGAIAFALADSALAFASNAGEKVSVSIENTIRYPYPVKQGDELEATAVERSAGRKIAFYDISVRNRDGTEVALFTGTVYRTGKDFPWDGKA